jgi:multiple sugar transport system permease protein
VTAVGRGRTARGIAWYTALIGIGLVIAAPLLWMVSTSVKSNDDATTVPPRFLPRELSDEGYRAVLTAESQTPVLRWFLNSLAAASLHAVLVLLVASTAAYALARMTFPGRRVLFGVIVATLFVPPFALLIPNYLIADQLGWLDSLTVLVVPGAASAFGVFFLRQFFLSLPVELEEAAELDGANSLQIFLRVVLPLSRPALATLAVLSFLTNWNDFLWPVYVLFSPDRLTLPPGLNTLQSAYTTDYPVIMAGAVLASVPVLVLFVIAQRHVIEGVSRSGIKG